MERINNENLKVITLLDVLEENALDGECNVEVCGARNGLKVSEQIYDCRVERTQSAREHREDRGR